MYHLFIDTNLYREDPARNRAFFRAVSRLSTSGHVRLCVPHFTENEFLSQQIEDCREQIDAADHAIKRLLSKKINNSRITALLSDSHRDIMSVQPDMEKAIKEEFNSWLASVKAIRLPILAAHAQRVADGYFSGGHPFKEKKSREDFPDAFIYVAIEDLQKSVAVHAATRDKNLRESLAQLENVTCYASLGDFINLPEIRNILDALDESENLRKNLSLLKLSIDANMTVLRLTLGRIIREAMEGEYAYGSDIPTNDGEAEIQSVRFINDVRLDLELLEYYGGGDLVIPFTCSSDGTVSYVLDIDEFKELDESKFNHIDTHWESEYYVRIKDPYTFSCKGTLLFTLRDKLPKTEIDTPTARSFIERSDVAINSIVEIGASSG